MRNALKSDPQIRQADPIGWRRARRGQQAWSALLPQLTGTLSRTQERQDGS